MSYFSLTLLKVNTSYDHIYLQAKIKRSAKKLSNKVKIISVKKIHAKIHSKQNMLLLFSHSVMSDSL